MIAGKGDHAFALRTEKNMLYFFIHAGGEWRSVSCEWDTSAGGGWQGKMHQFAGIYNADQNTISIYCDGKMVAEKATGTTSGVTSSGFDFTIGACPETGRGSMAEFYEVRVYSKALSAAELASQNTASPTYAPDSKDVQLWLDFDNLADAEPADDIPEDDPDKDKDKDTDKDVVYGDATCDGHVMMNDAVLIMQALANPSKFGVNGTDENHITEQGELNADVAERGTSGITNKDALQIQRFLLELIDDILGE